MGERTCTVEDCAGKRYGHGYCSLHYQRWRKTGSTDPRAAHVPKVCKVEDCERQANVPGSARGWCASHYQKWQRHGDPAYVRPVTWGVDPCSIDGCTEVIRGRGWCTKHWTRWRRYGDPTARIAGEVVDGKRICPQCNEDKPLAEWTKGYCKACVAANMRLRREDPAEKLRIAEYSRRYSEANPGVVAQRARDWRKRNPDQVRAATAERRARRVSAHKESFTPREIFDRDEWMCGICGAEILPTLVYPDPMSVSLDHVVPLSRGGFHERSNCQAAHLICNVRKGARVS